MAAQPASLPHFSDSSKLDGSNFPIWKMKIVSILRSYNHYAFVTTSSGGPIVGLAGTTQADFYAWDLLTIRCIPFSFLIAMIRCYTAPKVWIVLCNMYEMKTPDQIITLETPTPKVSILLCDMYETRPPVGPSNIGTFHLVHYI